MELFQLIILFLILAIIGLLVYSLRRNRSAEDPIKQVRLEERLHFLQENIRNQESEFAKFEDQVQLLQAENLRLERELSDCLARLESERANHQNSRELLTSAREELGQQFQLLAQKILEEKSQKFAQSQSEQMGQILEPLRAKLTEFQNQVQEAYNLEGKERFALGEQVKQLLSLNQRLSEDAHNLTKALRGDNKTQGNWGEMILESILEGSGLRKGFEYETQASHTQPDGTRLQPDVILHLPEQRHLIIDSKVSLLAYEKYSQAEPGDRDLHLRQHLDSLRAHIKGLSNKQYEKIHGNQSPDFVLLFIPIEPAFMLGISQGSNLWQEAWDKNVLLVSPSTLLFVLRTIAQLWRQENQNKNALEISKRGAELYDKFSGFLADFKEIGVKINLTQKAYEGGLKKLGEGQGNLLWQAQKLTELGVKPSKNLPSGFEPQSQQELP